MKINTSIPVSVVRENFKALEPSFKKSTTITIDGEKWRIHRTGSRKKLNRKSETIYYFRFEPLESSIEETCFFSISSRTNGISLVTSFYEGTRDSDDELFMLIDGTGIFTVEVKKRSDEIQDRDMAYEIGQSINFHKIAFTITEKFGKSEFTRSLLNNAAYYSTYYSMGYSMNVSAYDCLALLKIKN